MNEWKFQNERYATTLLRRLVDRRAHELEIIHRHATIKIRAAIESNFESPDIRIQAGFRVDRQQLMRVRVFEFVVVQTFDGGPGLSRVSVAPELNVLSDESALKHERDRVNRHGRSKFDSKGLGRAGVGIPTRFGLSIE